MEQGSHQSGWVLLVYVCQPCDGRELFGGSGAISKACPAPGHVLGLAAFDTFGLLTCQQQALSSHAQERQVSSLLLSLAFPSQTNTKP